MTFLDLWKERRIPDIPYLPAQPENRELCNKLHENMNLYKHDDGLIETKVGPLLKSLTGTRDMPRS